MQDITEWPNKDNKPIIHLWAIRNLQDQQWPPGSVPLLDIAPCYGVYGNLQYNSSFFGRMGQS